MGHACTPDPHHHFPPPDEHPVIAALAVIAILAAVAVIAWARIEVHGLHDVEAALAGPVVQEGPPFMHGPRARTDGEREVEEAVAAGRFATGFSP